MIKDLISDFSRKINVSYVSAAARAGLNALKYINNDQIIPEIKKYL
jgi:hypothetical protein